MLDGASPQNPNTNAPVSNPLQQAIKPATRQAPTYTKAERPLTSEIVDPVQLAEIFDRVRLDRTAQSLNLSLFANAQQQQEAVIQAKANASVILQELNLDAAPASALTPLALTQQQALLYQLYASNSSLNAAQKAVLWERIGDIEISLNVQVLDQWQKHAIQFGGDKVQLSRQHIYLDANQKVKGLCVPLSIFFSAAAMQDVANGARMPNSAASLSHVETFNGRIWSAINHPHQPQSRLIDAALQTWLGLDSQEPERAYAAPEEGGLSIHWLKQKLERTSKTEFYSVSTDTHTTVAAAWGPEAERAYLFYDPNFGSVIFHDSQKFEDFLKFHFQNENTRSPGSVQFSAEGHVLLACRPFQADLNNLSLLPEVLSNARLKLADLSEPKLLSTDRFKQTEADDNNIFQKWKDEKTVLEHAAFTLQNKPIFFGHLLQLKERAEKNFLIRNHWSPLAFIDQIEEQISGQQETVKVTVAVGEDQPLETRVLSDPYEIRYLRNLQRLSQTMLEDLNDIHPIRTSPATIANGHVASSSSASPSNSAYSRFKQLRQRADLPQQIFKLTAKETASLSEPLQLPTLYRKINPKLWAPLLDTFKRNADGSVQMHFADREALARFAAAENATLKSEFTVPKMQQLAASVRRAYAALLKEQTKSSDWIPLLDTLEISADGQTRLQLQSPQHPQQRLTVHSTDPAFGTLKRFIDHSKTALRGGAVRVSQPVGSVHTLELALAAQALIDWFGNRGQRLHDADEDGLDHRLAQALKAHYGLNVALIGSGLAQDGVDLLQLLRTPTASHLTISGSSLAKASRFFGPVNFLGNAASVGLDIFELTRSKNEAQTTVLGTRLTFDSANLAFSGAAIAGAPAAAPAGVLLAGIGVGTTALIEAFLPIAAGASGVGRYFYELNQAYTLNTAEQSGGYRYDARLGALLPLSPAVIRQLDLKNSQVQFDSQQLYSAKHGSTGSSKINYFFWAGDKPRVIREPKLELNKLALNIRERLGIPAQAKLPQRASEANQIVLPGTPKSYIDYHHELLPFATARNDAGFDTLRQLEGDDFDFDFYVFPSEYIINQISLAYIHTPVEVKLGARDRHLQMPLLAPETQGYLHYTLQAESGQFIVGLQKGAALTLSSEQPQHTRWVLDARALADDRISFGDRQLLIGGITVHIDQATPLSILNVVSKNSEILEVNLTDRQIKTIALNASEWRPNPQDLSTHLRTLASAPGSSGRYVHLKQYALPNENGRKIVPNAYYEVAKDRYLYAQEGEHYPDVEWVAQFGETVYFYDTHRTRLLRTEANTHQVTATYTLVGDKPLNVWEEAGELMLAPAQDASKPKPIYQVSGSGLALLRIQGDDTLLALLQKRDSLDDLTEVFARYLQQAQTHLGGPAALSLPATRPDSGYILVESSRNAGVPSSRYWVRIEDQAVIHADSSVGPDSVLLSSAYQKDGQEVFYFFNPRQPKLYRQVGAKPSSPQDKATAIVFPEPLRHAASLQGMLYATTSDGKIYHVDADATLSWSGVDQHWLKTRSRWWQDLGHSTLKNTLSVLDVQSALTQQKLPVWYREGTLVVAADKLPASHLSFIGFSPDKHSAWLHDAQSGWLYQQPLMSHDQLAKVFDAQGQPWIANASVPTASKIAKFDAIEVRGNRLRLQMSQEVAPHLPLVRGIEHLQLTPNLNSASYTIEPAVADYYPKIVVEPLPAAATSAQPTPQFSIRYPVEDPAAVNITQCQNDRCVVNPSNGHTLQATHAEIHLVRDPLPHPPLIERTASLAQNPSNDSKIASLTQELSALSAVPAASSLGRQSLMLPPRGQLQDRPIIATSGMP